MIPPTPAAPNDRKIADQMYYLRMVRTTGGVPIGWDADQIPPSTVRALELAGLVRIDKTPQGRVCRPV